MPHRVRSASADGPVEQVANRIRKNSADAGDDEAPAVIYSGEEIDIRLYGDMAVIAFKLVGAPADGSEKLYYYNTGTFLKRDGTWRVVAWQATKIPSAAGS